MTKETITEPLVVQPRLDPKPWGGTQLAHFGIDLDGSEAIGEAVFTSNDAVVAQGRFRGMTLGELVALDPVGLLGRAAGLARSTGFPLLVKLIDAQENLSIQVHPSDALVPPDECGKTEAWYILAAVPDAVVYAGLNEGVTVADVRRHLERGESIVPLVQAITVRPGDVLFLPAGTIHALGAGIVLYEIQQQSAITYRLEDWGRAREMHIEQGLAALDDLSRPHVTRPTVRRQGSGSVPAVECAHFSFEPIELDRGGAIALAPEQSPQVLTCISGPTVLWVHRKLTLLRPGRTAIVPANARRGWLFAPRGARLLRGWIGG